ncbi:MAG: hypothetical protein JWO38_1096 [Gemmataceae bacterium]|nr:hypothetical protein [Gemmataceae bacterium]
MRRKVSDPTSPGHNRSDGGPEFYPDEPTAGTAHSKPCSPQTVRTRFSRRSAVATDCPIFPAISTGVCPSNAQNATARTSGSLRAASIPPSPSANAGCLTEIIDRHGWPGRGLVGEDGARAACVVLQHAIGHPALLRRGLVLSKEAVARGEVPAVEAAMLGDRIAFFAGRPQRYGTQYDWTDQGVLAPWVAAGVALRGWADSRPCSPTVFWRGGTHPKRLRPRPATRKMIESIFVTPAARRRPRTHTRGRPGLSRRRASGPARGGSPTD